MAAEFDFSASFLTSEATTANPRPCSPALAASIAAFSANRLVRSAISLMRATISPISADRWPRSAISSAYLTTVSRMRFISITVLFTVSEPDRARDMVSSADTASSSVLADTAFMDSAI